MKEPIKDFEGNPIEIGDAVTVLVEVDNDGFKVYDSGGTLIDPAEDATVQAVRERQAAIEELRPRLDLREETALLDAEVRRAACGGSHRWKNACRSFTRVRKVYGHSSPSGWKKQSTTPVPSADGRLIGRHSLPNVF